MKPTTDVVVAVATIGPPEGCRATVQVLLEQDLPAGLTHTILVVDNNPVPRIVDLPSGVMVHHEPLPGIAAARNAAVKKALELQADVLAFVDDDEIPADREWLAQLVGALEGLPADVATGPVVRDFEPTTPQWIRAQPVFRRRRHPTGQRLQWAATNNVAYRASVFTQLQRWFDTRFGLVGGSDTDLSRRLAHAGHVIRWVDEAVVRERVDSHRATVGWILRRSWRLGTNRAQRRRWGTPGEPPSVIVVGGSIAEVALGSAAALLLMLPSRRLALMALGRATRGAGTLAGWCGITYREYQGRAAL